MGFNNSGGNTVAGINSGGNAELLKSTSQALNVYVTGGGGTGPGGPVSIADGLDVAEGATTDAAVFGNADGTISAKLRAINALMLGLGTASAPATASVTNSDSVVIAANANRKKMVVTNLGAINVYFGDNHTAALNSGIVLTPNGTWVMDSYTFSTAAIHAICSGSSTLAIQEYV